MCVCIYTIKTLSRMIEKRRKKNKARRETIQKHVLQYKRDYLTNIEKFRFLCVLLLSCAHTQPEFGSASAVVSLLLLFFCSSFVRVAFSRFISLFRIYLSFYLLFSRCSCNPSRDTYLFGWNREPDRKPVPVSMLCVCVSHHIISVFVI